MPYFCASSFGVWVAWQAERSHFVCTHMRELSTKIKNPTIKTEFVPHFCKSKGVRPKQIESANNGLHSWSNAWQCRKESQLSNNILVLDSVLVAAVFFFHFSFSTFYRMVSIFVQPIVWARSFRVPKHFTLHILFD